MSMKNKYKLLLLLSLCVFGLDNSKAEVIYSIPLEGQEHQIGSLLNWTTANEINSQVFIVERSIDGIDYQVIGEIEAAGNTADESGYRFLDVGVSDEKAFYRLRQVDTDGTASFSQTIMIHKKLSNNFMIMAMSNTLTNKFFSVTIDALVEGEISYAVKSKYGEVLFEDKQELFNGINEITVNVEDEPEGTYFIVLSIDDEKEQLVIRKVDDAIKKKENVASKKQSNDG